MLEYSCDPVLNQIIVSHKVEYAQYTVDQLTILDVNTQRAIFRSYETAKKREIWTAKIKFLLENENYSLDEFLHVNKLLDNLNENYFNNDSIVKEKTTRTQFFMDWQKYALDSLGWTDKYILFVIYRLYTIPQQLDDEISAIKTLSQQTTQDSETISNCGCSISNDLCIEGSCVSTNCQQTSGCGPFWQFTCDGGCF